MVADIDLWIEIQDWTIRQTLQTLSGPIQDWPVTISLHVIRTGLLDVRYKHEVNLLISLHEHVYLCHLVPDCSAKKNCYA